MSAQFLLSRFPAQRRRSVLKLTIAQKLSAAFGSAALVLLVGMVSVVTVSRLATASRRVRHTYQVALGLESTLSRLKDAETGQRGYVITGDSGYLAPYLTARARVDRSLASLRQLTADNPVQRRRLDTLDVLAREKFAELEETLRARDSGGFPAAALAVESHLGKRVMDRARGVVAAMQAEEARLLAERERARRQAARLAIAVVAAGTAGAFVLIVLIIRALRRDVIRQLESQVELERQATQLEEQAMELEEQASELEHQVDESQGLAEELEKTNAALEQTVVVAEAARREAAAASEAKSVFLATMSHEIRTPINAIVGYAELLEMELSGPLTDTQRAQLGRVRDSAKHLSALVSDVLDLARVESGRLTADRTLVVAGDAVDAALSIVRPQAAAKGVALGERCDGETTGLLVGDADRVRQILINLLSNAVKFTPNGGRVTVSCRASETPPRGASLPADVRWMAIGVSDTGTGIPPEQLAAIFDPFTQGQTGYTRQQGGSGLGLTISRRLARLMGGEVMVESRLGEGSVFTLWLQAADGVGGRTA